ncbi:cyclophilin-like fold protein [Roseibium sp. Sym1]|uniref:cyclophilin-like fold protein n=1 Tax=Roseibium sp. Sym1 TaxID=3016006 RepID=UPI0022B30088|nr:cyclophilin-like fold protein [Roseibium sp. Sym1]
MCRLKPKCVALLFALAFLGPAAAGGATETQQETVMTRIQVIAGDKVLAATLDDTPAGRDFASMLPLDLTLTDYHGIEKVADLPRELNTTGSPASYAPKTGDITLYAPWGNLAIFYKPFQSSRGLVRLGEFDGPLDALIKDAPVPIRIEAAD